MKQLGGYGAGGRGGQGGGKETEKGWEEGRGGSGKEVGKVLLGGGCFERESSTVDVSLMSVDGSVTGSGMLLS